MKNPTEIRLVADARIKEATVLIKRNMPDSAFYLAGYAVELQLKAKICEHLDLPDFYSSYAPKSDLSKTFLVHNFDRLLLLSGLYAKFDSAIKADAIFEKHWLNIRQWSKQSRYDMIGTRNAIQVLNYIESIKIIIKWIKRN